MPRIYSNRIVPGVFRYQFQWQFGRFFNWMAAVCESFELNSIFPHIFISNYRSTKFDLLLADFICECFKVYRLEFWQNMTVASIDCYRFKLVLTYVGHRNRWFSICSGCDLLFYGDISKFSYISINHLMSNARHICKNRTRKLLFQVKKSLHHKNCHLPLAFHWIVQFSGDLLLAVAILCAYTPQCTTRWAVVTISLSSHLSNYER